MSARLNPVLRPASAALSGGASALAAIPSRLRRRTAGGAYRPEIDGLRLFAIAIVVFGHLAERFARFFPQCRAFAEDTFAGQMLQRPGLGVYLFFAVSGFILASQARRAKISPLAPAFLRGYFGRRVLRIEPPYLILLVATFLFMALTGFSPEGTKQFDTQPHSLALSFAGSVVYLHDLVWGTYPRLFPPGWSLEVEVQFYVLAPLFFALWFASRSIAVRLSLAVVGLLGGSVLSLLAPDQAGGVHLGASILRYLHFFWLGLVLADAQESVRQAFKRLPAMLPGLVGWSAFALYLLVPNAPDADTVAAFGYGLLLRLAALACVAGMFAAVFAPSSSFRTVCAHPWVSLIGGACYSLYLTHLQIIQLATALAAKLLPDAGVATLVGLAVFELAIVLAVGLAFYALIERTFMRPDWPQALRAWLASPTPRPAGR